ncbi:hypothetical protein CHS0354_005874 [Potamilus streckersoni]|uniref:Uncharacterized protein n=1 Tax=Potamilus streckersoni TaxID=2493646 RepID=A0AAE0T840_9BIVA|nr:hypothetical protein CHS0354_005874 [Potamilus streckersoni]
MTTMPGFGQVIKRKALSLISGRRRKTNSFVIRSDLASYHRHVSCVEGGEQTTLHRTLCYHIYRPIEAILKEIEATGRAADKQSRRPCYDAPPDAHDKMMHLQTPMLRCTSRRPC